MAKKTRILIFLIIFSITRFSYSQCPLFYDFYGNLNSTNLLKGWNGYFRDELCQKDVYFYKIHVVFHNNTEEKLVRHLTLIRYK